MDARDELRAALEQEQADHDADERKRRDLDRQREAFERDEASIRQQLYEAAEITAAALPRATTPPERVPTTPPPRPAGLLRYLERQSFVTGWRLDEGSNGYRVLLPDGTLVLPSYRKADPGSSLSNLTAYLHTRVDIALRDVRRGFRGGSERPVDFFAEAFGSGPSQGQDDKIQELRRRLTLAQESVTRSFAGLLHTLGVSQI